MLQLKKLYLDRVYNLSEDIYVIVRETNREINHGKYYKVGEYVRLIDGISDYNNKKDDVIGNHYADGYVTVCSVRSKVAEHHGVHKYCLSLASKEVHDRFNSGIDFSIFLVLI